MVEAEPEHGRPAAETPTAETPTAETHAAETSTDGAEPVKVLIVDDHPVVRQGLRTFLASRPGLRVVGEAADGEEGVRLAAALRPDVVLMDLELPRLDGVGATRQLRALQDPPAVIVLTGFGHDERLLPAVEAGAAGYLLKDVDPPELEAAIHAARRGEALLHPKVAGQLLQQLARPAAPPGDREGPGRERADALTPREREVLALLARGHSNREIARTLVVSEKTVKTHVSSILTKLGLLDRTQAALFAVRNGLTDP